MIIIIIIVLYFKHITYTDDLPLDTYPASIWNRMADFLEHNFIVVMPACMC